MAERAGIFPTFFLSGFECSTFHWKDQGRRDLVAETQHRAHAREDYDILRSGICDLVEEGDDLRREPAERYVAELRRWQKLLNRVTELDEDPFSDPVDLADVVAGAQRYRVQADKNWS
jgi:hypothetical protein